MKKNFFDYLFICHKMPSRSFFYKGRQFPICARCTGMFIGYIIGIVTVLFYRPHFVVFITASSLLMLPLVIDGGLQYKTRYESTNIKRLITGMLGGIAIIFFTVSVMQMGYANGQWLKEQLK